MKHLEDLVYGFAQAIEDVKNGWVDIIFTEGMRKDILDKLS